jgi:hypothetical protein
MHRLGAGLQRGGQGDVMDRGLVVEVHRVVVAAAAQEGEEIGAPVRDAKAERVAMELHDALHVGSLIGDVAKFQRYHAVARVVLRREVEIGKHLDGGAFGIGEGGGLADVGRDVGAPLAAKIILVSVVSTVAGKTRPKC